MNSSNYQDLLNDVRRDLSEARAKVDDLLRLEAYLTEKCESNGSASPPSLLSSSRGQVNLKGMTQERAAICVLRSAWSPLKTREIVSRMLGCGYEKPENIMNLINSVYGALSRSGNARKIDRGTWEYVADDDETT